MNELAVQEEDYDPQELEFIFTAAERSGVSRERALELFAAAKGMISLDKQEPWDLDDYYFLKKHTALDEQILAVVKETLQIRRDHYRLDEAHYRLVAEVTEAGGRGSGLRLILHAIVAASLLTVAAEIVLFVARHP